MHVVQAELEVHVAQGEMQALQTAGVTVVSK